MGNKIETGWLLRGYFSLAVVFCCLTVGGTAIAQNKRATIGKISFTDQKWADVLKLAKQTDRVIFVDAYASWCGPCKDIKARTFTNARVAAYFNAHFINVSIDMEKGEGLRLADQFAVDSYPTLLFIDDSGQILRKSEGFLDAGELLELADKVKIKK
jgi:thioredoxin 1